MKRALLLILASLTLLTSACAAQSSGGEGQTKIPNPMVELEASQQEVLGMMFTVPEEMDVSGRWLISETIAQINFSLDGRQYTYRAASAEQGDISGLYVDFEEEALGVNVDAQDYAVSATVRFVKETGGALAQWETNGRIFSLYTPDAVDAQTITGVITRLAEHYASENHG